MYLILKLSCECNTGYQGPDTGTHETEAGGCTLIPLIDECNNNNNDCHEDALCTDTIRSYTCACPESMTDIQPRFWFYFSHHNR